MNQDELNNEKPIEEEQFPSMEDLLRLKRHERPEPESWESFQHEFRRRAIESVVNESARFGRWQRFLLQWFAPALGLGAMAAAFLIFGGGIFGSHSGSPVSQTGVVSQESHVKIDKVSSEVAESRGGEFVDGAIALSVGEDADGVETSFLGKSLRYSSKDAVFEESALTLLSSKPDQPILPVTF